MPQFPFNFGPNCIDGCLFEEDFMAGEMSFICRQIVQFIPQQLWVLLLVMVDGIQGGFITFFLEDGIPDFSLVNQFLAG